MTGYVPELHPILAETAAFMVPLLSGGSMRVKILDAWAWGLPVVSTSIGAEGIEYHDGVDLRIADRAEDFAQAVASLLERSEERTRFGESRRAAVEARYDRRVGERRMSYLYPQWGVASAPLSNTESESAS